MNRFIKILLVSTITIALLIGAHLYYLSTMAATEEYPNDTFLQKEVNKMALIIVAHDDDAVGSAGTMAMLSRQGWRIREMCFFQQAGINFKKDSARNVIRRQSLAEVASIQDLEGIDPVDFNFRSYPDNEKAYMPIPYEEFAAHYKIDSLKRYIAAYIDKYKPTVIFTLDEVMGGYGNPEHVMISRLVLDYCRSQKNDPSFSVKRIYQPVFPPSLAENVLGKLPVFAQAKITYHTVGMPAPDVQVNFYPYAKEKKAAMVAYKTEQNSLKQIWPYYNWYPASIYFKIFDRDFFRVIETSRL